MCRLNGFYTQRFNRTHARVGHVFQGRYKAILFERDIELPELARYVVLNLLWARMIQRLETWPWSSCLATCGETAFPLWLQTDWIQGQFGQRRSSIIAKYVSFIHEVMCLPSV